MDSEDNGMKKRSSSRQEQWNGLEASRAEEDSEAQVVR